MRNVTSTYFEAGRRTGRHTLKLRQRFLMLPSWQFFVCPPGSSLLCAGLSLVAERGAALLRRRGCSLWRRPLLRSRRSGAAAHRLQSGLGSLAHRPSCFVACEVLPHQEWNPCHLHQQANSLPLDHEGSPCLIVLRVFYAYESFIRYIYMEYFLSACRLVF